MALILGDRIKETTTVAGTGTATLLGATTGFQSFTAVGNGNTTYYCIADQGGPNWEVGIGTYTASGTTLARTTVLASSNAGALVVFTTGVKDVFVTYPSEKGVWYDASGNVLFTGTTTAANLAYTGTLTGSTGILNIGSGQLYKGASGNVGIGTSSPTAKAQIGDSTVVTTNRLVFGKAQTASESNLPAIGQQSAGVGNDLALAATSTSANVRFYTGVSTNSGEIGTGSNTERMRIDSSGNVGIGTSSPILGLTIKNDTGSTTYGQRGGSLVLESNNVTAGGGTDVVWSTGTQTNQRYASVGSAIDGNDGASGSRGNLVFATKATSAATTLAERMRIASSGIVTMNAYGAGAATFSASGVISSVSDETWKIKDGIPVNPDEMIQKLKPGYWFYNAEKSPIFGTDRQLGFYAQNVNEAIGIEAAPVPEEGKPWGYYDRSVLAVAVMSLQKALTTIESLTERLTALENK